MTKVKITETAVFTLNQLVRYMVEFVGEDQAMTLADRLIDLADQKISSNPQQFPDCPELDSIGVTDYRQITVDKYEILYRFDDIGGLAYVTAFLRHKQSAQELLLNYVLQK